MTATVTASRRALYLHVTDQTRLDDACAPLWRYFPDAMGIYLVGSVLERGDFRDVDVRLILSDAEFVALPRSVRKLLNLTVSVWLQQVTCLPVDFQIQHMTSANLNHPKPRSALGAWARGVTP